MAMSSVVEKEERLNMLPRMDPYAHRLVSRQEGESEVELLAKKIEVRRDKRVPMTFEARVEMLNTCREIATNKRYPARNKIKRQDLVQYRENVFEKVKQQRQNGVNFFHSLLGTKSTQDYLLGALARAQQLVDMNMDSNQMDDSNEWFHYQDFNFYHTRLVSKWPWMRNECAKNYMIVLGFFLSTPLLFCGFMNDSNICSTSTNKMDWVNGLYFASVTLSTVGYGDMTVDKKTSFSVLVGILYMIVSICVSILAFSAAADEAFSPLENWYNSFFEPDEEIKQGVFLYKRIRFIKALKLGEILFQFICLNMIGVVASRFFDENYSSIDGETKWTWLESFYWSVQSTTTIGYGDMAISPKMRLFQVFYLSLGTYFVGNTLGKLQSLKTDIESLRRLYAWERREVNKEMLRTDQADNDGKVDQYEFVVASLLNLGKITSDDIQPIMDKFRKLATQSGYIQLGDISDDDQANSQIDPEKDYKTF